MSANRKDGRIRVGRPNSYETAEALQNAIDNYLDECADTNAPLSVSGLAKYIGVSRQTLSTYYEKDEFYLLMDRTRGAIEYDREKRTLANMTRTEQYRYILRRDFDWDV